MNILIPLYTGSEYRQFFLSGIAKTLIDNNNQIFVVVKEDYEHLLNEIKQLDNRIRILHFQEVATGGNLYSYLNKILDINYETHYTRFYYSKKESQLLDKVVTIISRTGIINFIKAPIQYLIDKLIYKIDVSTIKKVLIDNDIDEVIHNSARREAIHSLLIASYQLNIPIKILFHSNKEVFAQNRISFPFTSLGVWNEEMKFDLLKRNNKLSIPISVIGNTHFSYLQGEHGVVSVSDFYNRFNIQREDRIILYTAAGIIIKNEHLIVKEIVDSLKRIGENFKIIVRQNPMDNTSSWRDFFANEKSVYIQKPLWVMDHKAGMNYTMKDDLVEYKSVLKHSHVCVNIPSTVTIEAAIMHLPIVNICYDHEGVKYDVNTGRISEFWNQPYYRQYHNCDFVHPTFSAEELIKTIINVDKLDNKSNYHNAIKAYLGCDIDQVNIKTLQYITDNMSNQ